MSKIYLENFHFQAGRDTAENWNTNNPILCGGEFGVIIDSTDENWLKVGDGVTPWKLLPFKKGPKGNKGDKGDKGDPFVYSDFTDEQLALLKGAKGDTGDTGPRGLQGEKGATGATGAKGDKGDKGDAFTYEDFTAEQLAELKGAKGDKGEKGDKGDTGEVTALQMNTACANALRGTASGSAIRLTDVSPNEHMLGVKVKSKNLFDKNNANIIAGYIDTNVITAATTSRCIYIPCNPNTTYTVSKIATARFVVAFTNVIPTAGTAVTNRVQNYTATSITATSDADSKYIVVWIYNSAYDTSITPDEILATLQIEFGSVATAYAPYISDLSTVTVTRCRKNLIAYPYFNTTKTLNGITFTVNSDGSVTVSGTATAQAYFKLQQSFSLKKGQYFFSGCPTGGAGGTYSLYLSTSDYKFYKADIGNGISINAEDDKTVSIVINIAKDTTVNNLVFKPQLELGSTATAYEPYTVAEYTPAADGTVSGVKSLYPTTTLMTDTEGAIIDAKYNRDINKAFAEMQQAILSIGGNV